jgi:hypothetical protein
MDNVQNCDSYIGIEQGFSAWSCSSRREDKEMAESSAKDDESAMAKHAIT